MQHGDYLLKRRDIIHQSERQDMQHGDRLPRRGDIIQRKYIILLIVRIKIDMIVRIEKEKYVRLPVRY